MPMETLKLNGSTTSSTHIVFDKVLRLLAIIRIRQEKGILLHREQSKTPNVSISISEMAKYWNLLYTNQLDVRHPFHRCALVSIVGIQCINQACPPPSPWCFLCWAVGDSWKVPNIMLRQHLPTAISQRYCPPGIAWTAWHIFSILPAWSLSSENHCKSWNHLSVNRSTG